MEDSAGAAVHLPQIGDDGKFPFPLECGGTFIEVALRAQTQREWLLQESAALCFAAGLLKSEDVAELGHKYIQVAAALCDFVSFAFSPLKLTKIANSKYVFFGNLFS